MPGDHLLLVHQFGLPTISGLTVTLDELRRQIPLVEAGVTVTSLTYEDRDPASLDAFLDREHGDVTAVIGLNLHIEPGWELTLVLARWCRRRDIPLVVYMHDYWPHHKVNVANLIEELGAHLVAITPAIAEDLRFDGFAARLLPAGVVVPSEPSYRPRSPRPGTVGAVGRLVPRKRLPDLVSGYCRASRPGETTLEMRVPPSLVYSPGQDEVRLAEIREVAQRCPDADSITIDRRPRLGVHYGMWSVYTSASEYEGLSMTPLEALLHGCPVVLSDIPPHRTIVDAVFPERTFECLFPVGDDTALGDLLSHELRTATRRRDLEARHQEVHELISERWSLANTARQLLILSRKIQAT